MFIRIAGCRSGVSLGRGTKTLDEMNASFNGIDADRLKAAEVRKEVEDVWKKKSESVSHPPLKNFCCCRLRTGCLILGWFQVVFFTILIIVYSILYDDTKPEAKVKSPENGHIFEIEDNLNITDFASRTNKTEPVSSDQKSEYAFDINILITDLVDASLSILVVGFLLIGVYKDKLSFIKVFVIFFCLNICFEIIYGLCHYNKVMVIVHCLFSIMLGFVNVIVGYSYLSKLRNKEMFGKEIKEEAGDSVM